MLSCTQTCPDLNGIVGGMHHFARHHLRPHHSLTRQMSLFKIVCFGWGILCMLVFCCQGKRYASRNRLQECGVQESGDTLRNRGRVGSHWITTQTHWPGGALGMNNSATVGDYSGPLLFLPFSGVTDRHAAPRLCGHPAWILQDVLLITPYEYQNTIRLLYSMKERKAWRSCVDFSSCEHVDFSEVLGSEAQGTLIKWLKEQLFWVGFVPVCV